MIWLFLAAQVTDCSTFMGQTHCMTQRPNNSLNQLVGGLFDQQNQLNAQIRVAAQASQQRRADAYARVGDLIAQGRCDDAKKLAHFYNHSDIIRDTEKACN